MLKSQAYLNMEAGLMITDDYAETGVSDRGETAGFTELPSLCKEKIKKIKTLSTYTADIFSMETRPGFLIWYVYWQTISQVPTAIKLQNNGDACIFLHPIEITISSHKGQTRGNAQAFIKSAHICR